MIYIVAHKQVPLPDLQGYRPLQVGENPENFPGYLRDNTGDEIAAKNPNYCELTALYWIWKNTDEPFAGLVHYRRFFGKKPMSSAFSDVFSEEELRAFLDGEGDPAWENPLLMFSAHIGGAGKARKKMKKADIILAAPVHYHFDAKSQLLRSSCTEDTYTKLRAVIQSKEPAYLAEFDRFFSQNKASLYNMMYCRKEVLDAYCAWLFPILSEMEAVSDPAAMNAYQKRIYGFLAERLLNIWVRKNGLAVRYAAVVNTEYTPKEKLLYARRDLTNRVRYFFAGKKS